MSYQPLWDNGRHIKPGRRNTENRYLAVANYLAGRRGFTVLDFGSHIGYFARRLAHEFDAKCVAVDDHPKLQPAPGVETIHKRLTAREIRELGHFDVTLCLSVLHHIHQWRATLKAILDSAPTVFIETANPDEHLPNAKRHDSSDAIHDAVEAAGGRPLTYTPGYDTNYHRPLWVIDRELH